jgi:hypothetical protein
MSTISVPLSKGKFAIIDEACADLILPHRWFAVMPSKKSHKWYAARHVNAVRVWMHRVVAGTPAGMLTDHRDGDGLNNLRSNLRICTASQNQCNKEVGRGLNRFRGVKQSSGRFSAVIWLDNEPRFLGLFTSELDAARAYNRAALELHGEFARLNEVPE